jgi:hypothetical protein
MISAFEEISIHPETRIGGVSHLILLAESLRLAAVMMAELSLGLFNLCLCTN